MIYWYFFKLLENMLYIDFNDIYFLNYVCSGSWLYLNFILKNLIVKCYIKGCFFFLFNYL